MPKNDVKYVKICGIKFRTILNRAGILKLISMSPSIKYDIAIYLLLIICKCKSPAHYCFIIFDSRIYCALARLSPLYNICIQVHIIIVFLGYYYDGDNGWKRVHCSYLSNPTQRSFLIYYFFFWMSINQTVARTHSVHQNLFQCQRVIYSLFAESCF